MQNLTDQLRQAAVASADIGDGAAGYAALNELDLLDSQKQIARIRRNYDTHAAWVAGEIARRSSRALGFSGLAQRHGFLTPEALIQSETGGTRAEAAKLVAVGTLMTDTEAAEELQQADPGSPFATLPWLAVVAGAVRAGTLSIDAAEAIRKGLGDIDPGVPAEKLAAAAQFLLEEAASLNADQLLRRARRLRDELDADGIARREKTQRDARSFRIWRQDDGMYRVSALLPPEDGRLVELIVDGATSPRRGGPRFVDAATQARADALRDDERTTEQIAADAILALLQLGAEADPNTVFFGRRPAVRILVTEHDLAHTIPDPAFQNLSGQNPAGQDLAGQTPVGQALTRPTATGPSPTAMSPTGPDSTGLAPPGHGQIEGHSDPVSMDTVKRLLCSGYTGIEFDDDGQCINVGRDQRLFTQRQRTGLAARDGGCRWPGCDRPASWCEAHHIEHWKADHGKTDIADGILLCKAHHLLLHDNHWHVFRTGADYWLLPPVTVDAEQTPLPMPSKSPLMLERFPPKHPPKHPSAHPSEHPTRLTG
ncbi:HNH endonuclease signature motif containing protein [Leifsonia kafniensis]|uniref:HNH endonuclease signature motif containing protein n=1 Tax=Leifsonia kafniensis TaxID=475957 RepID=A0ABP7K8M8_9MICO